MLKIFIAYCANAVFIIKTVVIHFLCMLCPKYNITYIYMKYYCPYNEFSV